MWKLKWYLKKGKWLPVGDQDKEGNGYCTRRLKRWKLVGWRKHWRPSAVFTIPRTATALQRNCQVIVQKQRPGPLITVFNLGFSWPSEHFVSPSSPSAAYHLTQSSFWRWILSCRRDTCALLPLRCWLGCTSSLVAGSDQYCSYWPLEGVTLQSLGLEKIQQPLNKKITDIFQNREVMNSCIRAAYLWFWCYTLNT